MKNLTILINGAQRMLYNIHVITALMIEA